MGMWMLFTIHVTHVLNNSILTQTHTHRQTELLLVMQHFDISLHLGSCRIFDLAMFLLRQS